MPSLGLCQNLANDFPVHIGQAIIATGVVVGEAFVVEAHEVQQRGLQIMCTGRSAMWKPSSSVAPKVTPPRTPPPASHRLKACG